LSQLLCETKLGAVVRDFKSHIAFGEKRVERSSGVSSPQELEKILLPISEAGVDIFDASTRRFWVPEFSGSDLNLAGWAQKITGKPTMTVGSVGLNNDLYEALEKGSAEVADLGVLMERFNRGDFAVKAGLVGFSRGASRDLAPRNITVNVVLPEFTDTDMVKPFKTQPGGLIESIALHRFARPEEIAAGIASPSWRVPPLLT
jgi:hypothetical protein